jgi:hypothetical protein
VRKRFGKEGKNERNLGYSTISQFLGKKEQTAAVKVPRKVGKDERSN